MQIDVVITYVNMNDPVWIQQYQDTFSDKPSTNRYKDLGVLQLQIQCIHKFMPWVNNIYVVVSTESQVKNIQDAKIITHNQIIPQEFLPTFNSCTIEMFLHNIPDLTDYFIYFNDDIFPISPLDQKDFFNECPVLSFKTLLEPPVNMYRYQCKNSSDLAREAAGLEPSKIYIKSDHICTVHSKAAHRCLWDDYADRITKSITKKRETCNLNQYLFEDYLFYTNQCKIKRLDYVFLEYKKNKPEDIYNIIVNHKNKLICLQDNVIDAKYGELLTKALREITTESDPIDLVIPYVDNTDPNWKELYNANVQLSNGYGAEEERFRSYDLFKYFFRGIAQNMKFIHTIHLIVQSDSQVPSWLNTNKVHVVKHEDFIPKCYLPVFNSCTIEMFLHRIPGLSEKFIYANDDDYAISPMSKKDFFDHDTPVFGYKEDDYHNEWRTDKIRYNIHKLITGRDNGRVERIQHIFTPYLKSTIETVFKTYNHEILDSITRVRGGKNYSQWLFAVYQLRNLKCINIALPHVKTKLFKKSAKYFKNPQLFRALCFNDASKCTEEDVKAIRNELQKFYPNKCMYEI